MRQARISELKNHLSRYIAYVRRGGSVRVLDRNLPVAELVPARLTEVEEDVHVRELEKQGIIRRGPKSGQPLPGWWYTKPRPGKGAGVLQALLEERESRR